MDFNRAEYDEPRVPRSIEPEPVLGYVKALLAGFGAAVLGCAAYAIVGLSGFMVSIVSIGIGWTIAKAMMTVSDGVGGRKYQVAAAIYTYFAVSCGEIAADVVKALNSEGVDWKAVVRYSVFGPVLSLKADPFAAIGIFILVIGIVTAWRHTAEQRR